MTRPPTDPTLRRHAGRHHVRRAVRRVRVGGFTFVEVLFAIIILGIGSIMIAGMLPVAIKQTSDTRNAITGQAACEAGFAYLRAVTNAGSQYTLPPTDSTEPLSPLATSLQFNGVSLNAADANDTSVTPSVQVSLNSARVVPLTNALIAANTPARIVGGVSYRGAFSELSSLTGSRVIASDPRTQWLAFYGRSAGANSARVVLLGLRLANVESTDTSNNPVDRYSGLTLTNPDNDPRLLTAVFTEGGALAPDTIALSGTAQSLQAADTGAFVIVASSPSPNLTTDRDRPLRNNGRVFRLGKRRVDLDSGNEVYELQPGYDLPPLSNGPDGLPDTGDEVADTSMGTGTTTQVWLVGRGLLNPSLAWNATSNPYSGVVQDIAVLKAEMPLPR